MRIRSGLENTRVEPRHARKLAVVAHKSMIVRQRQTACRLDRIERAQAKLGADAGSAIDDVGVIDQDARVKEQNHDISQAARSTFKRASSLRREVLPFCGASRISHALACASCRKSVE